MIDSTLGLNIRNAWSSLANEDKVPLQAQVETAHQALVQFLSTLQPPDMEDVRHELLYIHSILNPVESGPILSRALELSLEQASGKFTPPIDKYGVIWGFGKFQQLDFHWTEALLSLLLNGTKRFPFGDAAPAVVSYPQDDFSVAIMGDWGTGDWGSNPVTCPAQKVANCIESHHPDIVIHLGDVYYAGSKSQESGNLLQYWPNGAWGNFTLNSNHEMYPGGEHYYHEALSNQVFAKQAKRSFFALETNSWILIGLDSAYNADPHQLYMDGSLWKGDAQGAPQASLLKQLASKGKPVIVFTHHNPLDYTGGKSHAPLYDQLMSVLPHNTELAYWYYGHIHIGALYESNVMGDGIRYRCLGHGALPWGVASILKPPNVLWSEKTLIPDSPDNRVANGFAILAFQGGNITETIYTEDNQISWPITI